MESHAAFLLNTYTQRLIRIKARQLARRSEFHRRDEEDLQQELTLRLLQRARHYDPARGALNTFAARVVNSLVASLLREQRRRRTGAGQRVASIERSGPGASGAEPGGTDRRRPERPTVAESAAQREQRDAVRRVLAELPPELRAVGARLLDATAADVARELGLSRYQLRKAVLALRARFQAAGLG